MTTPTGAAAAERDELVRLFLDHAIDDDNCWSETGFMRAAEKAIAAGFRRVPATGAHDAELAELNTALADVAEHRDRLTSYLRDTISEWRDMGDEPMAANVAADVIEKDMRNAAGQAARLASGVPVVNDAAYRSAMLAYDDAANAGFKHGDSMRCAIAAALAAKETP